MTLKNYVQQFLKVILYIVCTPSLRGEGGFECPAKLSKKVAWKDLNF